MAIDQVMTTKGVSAESSFPDDADISITVRFSEGVDNKHTRVRLQRKPSGTGAAGIEEWSNIDAYDIGTVNDKILRVTDAAALYRFSLDYMEPGNSVRVQAE